MKNQNDQKRKRNSFYRAVLTVLVGLVLSLFLTRLVLVNMLAASGERISVANQKIELLKEENQKLENEISKRSSLARIEALAKKEGFVKAENVEVLTESKPVARR